MKIVVDYDLCQGHAVCQSEAPAVFAVEDKGQVKVLHEDPAEEVRSQVERLPRGEKLKIQQDDATIYVWLDVKK